MYRQTHRLQTLFLYRLGPDGTVAVSLEGGVVELWGYSPASASLQRRQALELGPVLGIRSVRAFGYCNAMTAARLTIA